MKCFYCVLSLAILMGFAELAAAPLRPIPVIPEEYRVYNVLIETVFVHELKASGADRLVAICDETTSGYMGGEDAEAETIAFIQKELAPGAAVLADYKNKNRTTSQLKNLFRFSNDHLMIEKLKLREIEKRESVLGFWDSFYAFYPKASGVTYLSGVGFNKDRTKALVYMGNQSGGLAGAGYFYLLEKKRGIWTIKKSMMSWIS